MNLRDRVWSEVEKNDFIALPGKGDYSGLVFSKPCTPTQGRVRMPVGHAFLQSKDHPCDGLLLFSRSLGRVLQVVNIFYLEGVLILQKSSKILCLCLEGEPGPYPKAALSFLDCSSLVSWRRKPSFDWPKTSLSFPTHSSILVWEIP